MKKEAESAKPIQDLVDIIHRKHTKGFPDYAYWRGILGDLNYHAVLGKEMPTLRALLNACECVLPEQYPSGKNAPKTSTIINRALVLTSDFHHKRLGKVTWEELNNVKESIPKGYRVERVFFNNLIEALRKRGFIFAKRASRVPNDNFFEELDKKPKEESAPLQSINVSFSETEQKEEVKEKEVGGFRGYLFRVFKAIFNID